MLLVYRYAKISYGYVFRSFENPHKKIFYVKPSIGKVSLSPSEGWPPLISIRCIDNLVGTYRYHAHIPSVHCSCCHHATALHVQTSMNLQPKLLFYQPPHILRLLWLLYGTLWLCIIVYGSPYTLTTSCTWSNGFQRLHPLTWLLLGSFYMSQTWWQSFLVFCMQIGSEKLSLFTFSSCASASRPFFFQLHLMPMATIHFLCFKLICFSPYNLSGSWKPPPPTHPPPFCFSQSPYG